MQDESGVIRRIAWREICPWLIIFRSFRLSISLPVLLLATAGWVLTPLGDVVANMLLLGNEASTSTTWLPETVSATQVRQLGVTLAEMPNPIRSVYEHLLSSPAKLLTTPMSAKTTGYHLVCSLWNIAVWSFFAVAICRIAAVQFGRQERVDLRSAIHYAAQKYAWSVAAPLFPIIGILLAGIPIALLGALMRLDAGVFAAGLLWPFALVGGLIMAVLLFGLVAGWPLMWPTISSEHQGDAFEAFSRTYSYVFQRPLQYLFYGIVALLFGAISWLLVSYISEGVILLASNAASWGAGTERMNALRQDGLPGVLGFGPNLIDAFEFLVRIIAVAFNFSFFFCISTAIYLVLRRDVDRTDFDDVFMEDDHDQYSLPPLKPNADGVPGVSDEAKVANEPASGPAASGDSDDATSA
ncbi:MAG: hypothetical protein CMJ64_09835 [Planctomycetaceae bacterium]|nr:hypothetical protein [Planctomycetaceae bacterium]